VPAGPQVRRGHKQPFPGRTLPGKGCPPADTTGAGRHRTDSVRRATYGDLFAIREFRALWSAQTLSSVGDQIAQVAIAVLVYTTTGSPALTALAYALTYLPLVIAGPLLSGLAGLLPHRQAMIALDLLRAGLVTIMAIPAVPLPLLCTLLFATVLLGPPFAAARAPCSLKSCRPALLP
jgi:Transmembrane secretion effector